MMAQRHFFTCSFMIYNHSNHRIPADIHIHLFGSRPQYSQDQREFSLTLHLYGSKAYEYLRTKGFKLPHPRSLQRYLKSFLDINREFIILKIKKFYKCSFIPLFNFYSFYYFVHELMYYTLCNYISFFLDFLKWFFIILIIAHYL